MVNKITLEVALNFGKEKLKEANNKEFAIDAWYLLEFIAQVDRATYFGNPQMELEDIKWQVYQELIEKRAKKIPLQHLTGVQEFMGYVFQVNEHVLIPRQDTEILVEKALEQVEDGMDILDMCTGSGCILISLMAMSSLKGMKVTGTGVDKFKEALDMARRNAQFNQCDCNFIQSDLFENVEGTYHMMVSNPPYIPTKDIEDLEEEVKIHDPMSALDGFEDGLYFYRKITKESKNYLKDKGYLLFEIGYDQGEAVSSFLKEEGFHDVMIIQDLSGLDRVVMGQLK